MINEAQRLHEEFAQSSAGDSMTVSIAVSYVLHIIEQFEDWYIVP